MLLRAIVAAVVVLLVVVGQLSAAPRARTERPAPLLHFSLIDQLPPGGTAINGLSDRRRLGVFDAALQDLVRTGQMPRAEYINDETRLPAGTGSEKPQPPGMRIIRVFLTEFGQTRLGGASDTEIVCRCFVEEWQDGKRIAKYAPCFSRVGFEIALAPRFDGQIATYQSAARQALAKLAGQL